MVDFRFFLVRKTDGDQALEEAALHSGKELKIGILWSILDLGKETVPNRVSEDSALQSGKGLVQFPAEPKINIHFCYL